MGTKQRSQIVMSDEEIAEFIRRHRTANLATHGRDGIHLLAMWYAVIDGEIWFETKAKSQKIVNLRRARKDRDRAAKARAGDENAARHGLRKPERAALEAQAARLARALDGHRREDGGADGA